MGKVLLGDVAEERKETCKGSKEGYPIVGLEHLTPEEITLTKWDNDSDNTFTKMFREGDILFGRRRAYLKKAAVAPFDGICSGDITVIKAIPDRINPRLLPFIIQNNDLFDFAVSKSAGSLSPRVKWEHLKQYEFELPDIKKQEELTELLWAIDNTRKSYQRLIAATDELVKSQFIEQFGDVISNPKGWKKQILTNVCDFQGGSQPPKKDWIQEPAEGYIRMLQIRDFTQEGKFKAEYVRISNSVKTCTEDDVLIGRYGASVGKILTGHAGAYNVAIMKSIPDKEVLNSVYLLKYLLTPYFQDYIIAIASGRGAQAGFNKEDLSNREILLPPIDLQQQFAAFVQQSDKSKFELERALSELTATYKSIIKENLG